MRENVREARAEALRNERERETRPITGEGNERDRMNGRWDEFQVECVRAFGARERDATNCTNERSCRLFFLTEARTRVLLSSSVTRVLLYGVN